MKRDPEDNEAFLPFSDDADPWKAHFTEIDALLDRTVKMLAGETPLLKSRSHLVYDPDVEEAENEDLRVDVVSGPATGRLWPRLLWPGTPD
jgi:hypothetical protein